MFLSKCYIHIYTCSSNISRYVCYDLSWEIRPPILINILGYLDIFHILSPRSKSGKSIPKMHGTEPSARPSHFTLVLNQTYITPSVRDYPYAGTGTEIDPHIVDFIPNDPKNGFNLPVGNKWIIVMICAFSTLACSLASTVFAGAILQIESYFQIAEELAILSVSLFVLGFAVGPVVWGPLSEIYGRQIVFVATLGASVVFSGTSIACKENDIAALLVLRFLTGSFSSAAISNSPGVVADIFIPQERGLAIVST